MNKKTAALIVAGGIGNRMGTDIPKQFLEINGKELISYTIDTFVSCDFIDKIVVVCHQSYLEHCKEILDGITKEFVVVCGGKTRQESVYNGLIKLDSDYVLIHDAVRCLVTKEEIKRLYETLLKNGSCTLAVKAKDTIKISDENQFVAKTLPREVLWQIQTPQAFITKEILYAHEYAVKTDFIGTDDCSVMENINKKVKLVEGSYENIKITTPSDLEIAKVILKGRI